MSRPRKPAANHSHTDRNYTKSEIAKMRKFEEDIKGNSDSISEAPEYLSDLGRWYYDFIIKETSVSGILSNLDIPIVAMTAETLAIIQEVEEDIQENGMFYTVTDRNGDRVRKKNPALDVRDKNITQVKTLLTQLGMSPSSRASLAVANIEKQKEEADPLLSIINKKKAK